MFDEKRIMLSMKDFREYCHYTQEEMAELLNVSSRWYQKIESGEKKPGPLLSKKFDMFQNEMGKRYIDS